MAEDIIINGTVYQDVPAINIPKNVGYGGGTEEYVDYKVSQGTRDVSIPAGHNSKYYTNWTGDEYYEDKVPYSFRQTPGSGKRLAEEVVGATVAWNQLADETKYSASHNGVIIGIKDDHSLKFTGTPTVSYANLLTTANAIPINDITHKYLFNSQASAGNIRVVALNADNGLVGYYDRGILSIDSPAVKLIFRLTGLTVNVPIDATCTPILFIDLTALLGSIIADYLYTLESNTPGAGVAKFRELFPKDYYAYCEPTLQSVCVSKHIEANSDSTEINEYPLEAVELRGLFKLDSNNNIYADGDTYEGEGTVTRWYAILPNQSGAIGDTITLTGAKSNLADLVSTKGHLADIGTISGTTLTLTVALSGDDIVYELATPTTESADPFTNPQYTSGGGLVRYVYSNPAEGQEF